MCSISQWSWSWTPQIALVRLPSWWLLMYLRWVGYCVYRSVWLRWIFNRQLLWRHILYNLDCEVMDIFGSPTTSDGHGWSLNGLDVRWQIEMNTPWSSCLFGDTIRLDKAESFHSWHQETFEMFEVVTSKCRSNVVCTDCFDWTV